jgi:diphosphomevalonate decarboxylase
MKNHDFYDCRIKQADNNMHRILNALRNGEINEFIDIIELESLTLHALMMASAPGYFLFRPQTIDIIESIKKFRIDTGIPVGFSLDAGPNVHLLYPVSAEENVHNFIDTELRTLCEKERVIHDFVGKGPVLKKV